MKYKINDLVDCQDFEHDQEFMKVEDVVLLLNSISAKLLPLCNLSEIDFVRTVIKTKIVDLEEK